MRTVQRCLEKQVAKRYQNIGDVKVEIEKTLADPSGVVVQPVADAVPQSKLAWVAVAFAVGLVIAGVAVWNLRAPPEPDRWPRRAVSLVVT